VVQLLLVKGVGSGELRELRPSSYGRADTNPRQQTALSTTTTADKSGTCDTDAVGGDDGIRFKG
jgi:hypothetical protein